jgi:hypothetical protein
MMIPVGLQPLVAWEDHNSEITAPVSGDLIHEARTSAGLVNASGYWRNHDDPGQPPFTCSLGGS